MGVGTMAGVTVTEEGIRGRGQEETKKMYRTYQPLFVSSAFHRIAILRVIPLLDRRHRLVGQWIIETVATLYRGLASDARFGTCRPQSARRRRRARVHPRSNSQVQQSSC